MRVVISFARLSSRAWAGDNCGRPLGCARVRTGAGPPSLPFGEVKCLATENVLHGGAANIAK